MSHTVISAIDDLSDLTSFLLTSPSLAMCSTLKGFQEAMGHAKLPETCPFVLYYPPSLLEKHFHVNTVGLIYMFHF